MFWNIFSRWKTPQRSDYEYYKEKFAMGYARMGLEHLPFEPSGNEVIYVENEYNEATNRFILKNLTKIRKCFAKKNLMFVYLPTLTQELKTDDKVWRYRKPYGEIDKSVELPTLDSGYLLNFMCELENRKQIIPSEDYLFFGDICKTKNRKQITPCFARYYKTTQGDDPNHPEMGMKITHTYDYYTFDITRVDSAYEFIAYMSELVSDTLGWWTGIRIHNFPMHFDAEEAFDRETIKMLNEVKYKIALLRNKGVSDAILGELVKPEVKLSRIIIHKNYDITLPDYDNMEIKMTPLVKAVFILFLKHPEGILFKELSDYREELAAIYDDIKRTTKVQGKNEEGATIYSRHIVDVTNPLSNSINEKCTRIKEAFLLKFHESLAENYFITGKRGEPKRIRLPEDLIVWEE